MKKVIFGLLFFGCLTFKVCAKTPILEGNVFYANGYAITILERQDGKDGATIVWDGGEFNVDSSATIFGGGQASESYPGSNITMTGGTVTTIYGGGNGTEADSSDVGTSYITIDGGNVRNAVYGGGRLASKVTTVNIRIMSGVVNNVLGGGGASSGSFNVGSYETMNESLNHVSNANITVSGGTISSALFGGGQGFSLTNRTSIMVSGNSEITYLIGGGSNGRTDEIIINLVGGNIEIMQSVNRGTIGKSNITVNGARINYLYALGDITDSSVTGKIDDKGIVDIDVISGQINYLKPGTNNGIEVSNTSNIYIKYRKNTINNIKNLNKVFTNFELQGDNVKVPVLDDVPKTGINNNHFWELIVASIICCLFLKFKTINKNV